MPPLASLQPQLASVPMELQALFIGAVFLGSLIISHYSIRVGIPAILGVLLLGLAININALNVTHEEVEKLQLFALALLLFYADRKSTRLNSSHVSESRMPSSA